MVTRAAILQTMLQFLEEDTPIDVAQVNEGTALRKELGLDSVDFVGMIMRIEGHYRIRMTHAEMERLKTVGDLITLVIGKANPLAAAA